MGPPTVLTLSKCLTVVVLGMNVVLEGLGDPSPVMSFPDSGVYSLFPHEDLRTGKAIRTLPEQQFQQQRNSFSNRRGGGRILFDDERLNFRGHFDSKERGYPPPSQEQQRSVYDEQQRGLLPQAYAQSRLPPKIDEPTRVHVFNPESPRGLPAPPLPSPLEGSQEELRPGRLFIPKNNFFDLRDPGTNNFLNHDEFLDYQTRPGSLGIFHSQEERPPCKTPADARRLLFSSATIEGLVPPSSSSAESGGSTTAKSAESGASVQSFESSEVQSLEQEGGGKIHVTELVEVTPRVGSVKIPVLESGFIPIAYPPSPTAQKGEEELPRTTQTINRWQGTTMETNQQFPTIETTISPATTKKYPQVKKSPHVSPGHVTRIQERPWGSPSTLGPTTTRNKDYNGEDSETITFSPNTFDDFIGRRTSTEFAATKIRTEVPLIFLDSQQDPDSGGGNEKNAIFIKRLKNPKHSNGKGNKTVKSKPGIESSMTILSAELGSAELETQARPPVTSDEVKATRSMSTSGIVSRIHAHVSHCPKLLTGAEIICDVHIRKRHGRDNPQLIVGWKRKFHNATKEDVVLAINTTLAYIEEDFHDKFNVTLAPGISPMLRSVLSISRVNSDDTGNYECNVDDGENKLKSDTLLFLCH